MEPGDLTESPEREAMLQGNKRSIFCCVLVHNLWFLWACGTFIGAIGPFGFVGLASMLLISFVGIVISGIQSSIANEASWFEAVTMTTFMAVLFSAPIMAMDASIIDNEKPERTGPLVAWVNKFFLPLARRLALLAFAVISSIVMQSPRFAVISGVLAVVDLFASLHLFGISGFTAVDPIGGPYNGGTVVLLSVAYREDAHTVAAPELLTCKIDEAVVPASFDGGDVVVCEAPSHELGEVPLAISVNAVLTKCYLVCFGASASEVTDELCLLTAPLSSVDEIVALINASIIDMESALPSSLHSLGASANEIGAALAAAP